MRIVSLIASATEIVDVLGLLPFLAGRSHECDYPESVLGLPCCTRPRFDVSGDSREIDRLVKQTLQSAVSIYEVFEDVLEQLQPTHILTQTQCEVCAVSVKDVERALAATLSGRPSIVSLQPDSLADIWNDIRRVGQACGVDPEPVIGRLQARMPRRERTPRPAVACIEWIEPLMAAGNWNPELVELAGGVNLFGEAGRHSPWLTWEALRAADPDVIVVSPCGFDLERTVSEMHWLTGHPAWPRLQAVRTGRVWLADGNQYFNRPGPRVVEALDILNAILDGNQAHPLCPKAFRRWENPEPGLTPGVPAI